MFFQIYKTTLKNILRSKTFWLALILLFAVAVYEGIKSSYGYYDMQLKELIMDTDPRFILNYRTYIQHISNSCGSLLVYAIPIFAVISTVIVLTRDYGDKYFEIEKSYGQKVFRYLLGRLAGLIVIIFIAITLAVITTFYWYVFSRGGVNGLDTAEMLADSIVRLMRNIIFRAWTCALFYICFTYVVGSMFKTGIIGGIVGMGYAVVYIACNLMLRLRVDPFYFDYLSPSPNKLMYYLYYYDTEWFEELLPAVDTNLQKAAICICVLVGASLIYCVISCLCIRKREI